MKLKIAPGKYVVAVSGGVDSMVLLHMIATQYADKKPDFVVAHFDHGVRKDSTEDRKLVQRTAKAYGISFVYAKANLGPHPSEAFAREARYEFLHRVQKDQKAKAIITAHHQDDMLGTAIINLMRGTGRLGLSSLRSRPGMIRPMLGWGKHEIKVYAQEENIEWHEDSTNEDELYLRNYIRKFILPRLGKTHRSALLKHIETAGRVNDKIDSILAQDLGKHLNSDALNRAWYVHLPTTVAKEMMASWLRHHGILQFNRHMIERLVQSAKTAISGKLADVNAIYVIRFTKERIELIKREDAKTAKNLRPPKKQLANKPKI